MEQGDRQEVNSNQGSHGQAQGETPRRTQEKPDLVEGQVPANSPPRGTVSESHLLENRVSQGRVSAASHGVSETRSAEGSAAGGLSQEHSVRGLPEVGAEEKMAQRERAMACYQQGQTAFERGQYRQAVTALEEAVRWAKPTSRLGGEISLWLVNAYSAANDPQRAEALGASLARHPDWETRKQSQRLLYILQAPRLQLKPEWRTQIPDLTNLDDGGDDSPRLSAYPAPRRRRPVATASPEPEDLSQMNTQDNGFLWVALGAIAILLCSLGFMA